MAMALVLMADFNHPSMCWKDITVGHKQSKDSGVHEWQLSDIGNWGISEDGHSCHSSHFQTKRNWSEMWRLNSVQWPWDSGKILRGENKTNITDHKLDFRMSVLCLFRDLLGRILGNTVLKRGVQESLSRFTSSKFKNGLAIHPDLQVVKKTQQEACMDEQRTG